MLDTKGFQLFRLLCIFLFMNKSTTELSLCRIAYLLTLLLCFGCSSSETNWPEYNGGPDRNHYSDLTQFNKGNVSRLEKAWEYSSGGADTTKNQTQIQCNPIIIDGILYGVSAGSQAFALDAATGKELWKTSFTDKTFSMTSRGVTYQSDETGKRIFFGYGHLLYCLDANTGKPISSFGDNGKIDLKQGLERPTADDYVVYNTPGVIFENLLITGARVQENSAALLGDVRAFDVHTGELTWTFKTIPENGEFGSDTWPPNARQNTGGANSWMGMAIDRENEIVYVPTGSAAFDFYGGDRAGDNLFANCLLALNARTGERIWHFQTMHHDIWDRDLPAPPNLITLEKDGEQIPAVAQITKQGYVFVFNRLTGEPVFPIEERAMLTAGMPGEQVSPTQPFPRLPEPFTRQSFTSADVRTDAPDREEILRQLGEAKTGQAYIPLTEQRTIFFPGTDGGGQWGGAAVDPEGVMYVPAKEVPVYSSLTNAPRQQVLTSSSILYQIHCGSCHGNDMTGDHSGAYPSLKDFNKRRTADEAYSIIERGRGMMPAFTQLSSAEKKAIADYIMGIGDVTLTASTDSRTSPYKHTGYNRWYSEDGYPVNTPPWGTLTAIDLASGKRKWQVPLGEFPTLSKQGIPPTGTDNYGGPLVTGDLIFIAATPDQKFRAFDKLTGELVWETTLLAAGYASPSTYSVNGKQYLVIACGGGKLRSRSGDRYVAFALPD